MDWDQRYAAEGLLWTAQPNRFLVSEVGELAPGAALDVACGEGRNAIWLATKGWRVTAVDSSAVGIQKGTELAQEAGLEIDWLVEDATTYQPEPAFDLVAVFYLHLPHDQLRSALANACAGLAVGGTLLVVGHHTDNIEKGIGGPQVPELLYRPSDITDMTGGLEIEKAEAVERPVDRSGVTGIAIDTLVRARRA